MVGKRLAKTNFPTPKISDLTLCPTTLSYFLVLLSYLIILSNNLTFYYCHFKPVLTVLLGSCGLKLFYFGQYFFKIDTLAQHRFK